MQELKMIKTGQVSEKGERYTSPDMVFNTCRDMADLDREHFVVLHLDGKNRITARETVSIGSLNQAIVHPREVFKAAIHNGSAAIVCAHNHPTGDPEPSAEDIAITHRLCQAGDIIGIKVLDHIIIGQDSYFSFIEAGYISYHQTSTDSRPPTPQVSVPRKPRIRKTVRSQLSAAKTEASGMMNNYEKIKFDYPDSILFFDIGGTYKVFHEDAHLITRLLKTAPNEFTNWNGDQISVFSFPTKSLPFHTEKLIEYGHKVAICNPLPAGDTAKVQRQIILKKAA